MERKREKLVGIIPWVVLIAAVVLGALYLGIERARERQIYRDRHCIVEGTLVATPRGPLRIESIEPGEEVLSRSASGATRVGRVVSARRFEVDSFLRLTLSNGAILEVTSWHPIASGGGFREAGTLREGDVVELQDDRASITVRQLVEQRVRVYDLTVTPYANFFAGGVLVHNKSISEFYLPARGGLYYLTHDLSFAGSGLPRGLPGIVSRAEDPSVGDGGRKPDVLGVLFAASRSPLAAVLDGDRVVADTSALGLGETLLFYADDAAGWSVGRVLSLRPGEATLDFHRFPPGFRTLGPPWPREGTLVPVHIVRYFVAPAATEDRGERTRPMLMRQVDYGTPTPIAFLDELRVKYTARDEAGDRVWKLAAPPYPAGGLAARVTVCDSSGPFETGLEEPDALVRKCFSASVPLVNLSGEAPRPKSSLGGLGPPPSRSPGKR